MITISIVSGTYNRLKYLKEMINSARKSIGTGINYEFVIVDGGSTDGTIEWCELQNDIVLIKQGKLLGAVKAFNAGAFAARGKYVILANDDIEFIGYSILAALSFMEDNLDVGIGCFYQDRGNQPMHVGVMSGVVNGKQTTVNYGQVCIVPKWLGDKVGWWGDYLYTYGGDNELSCNVHELGYKVLPAPCAEIHDRIPNDALRVENNQKIMVNGRHPDTDAWLAKWTRNGVLGPVLGSKKEDNGNNYKDIRFFYMPIYERGHTIQKITKHGLRDAFAKYGIVVECDYMHMHIDDVLELACSIDANVFITQFHGCDQMSIFNKLKEQHPYAKFVNWNGDYHPEILFSECYINFMRRFDLFGVVTAEIEEIYDKANVNWFYWQIGYEDFIPNMSMPAYDVVFLANGYSKDRIALATQLRSLKKVSVGLYGSWPTAIKANGSTLYDFDAGAGLYKKCKIAIGDSQWPQSSGYVSNRLFQAMAAGAFMLQQHFDGIEEYLGLVDGKHLVLWTSYDDLLDKIKHYLKYDDIRTRIANAGRKYVLKNHSFDMRVKQLMEIL